MSQENDQDLKNPRKSDTEFGCYKANIGGSKMGLFKSREGMYPYCIYDIRESDIDKIGEPK